MEVRRRSLVLWISSRKMRTASERVYKCVTRVNDQPHKKTHTRKTQNGVSVCRRVSVCQRAPHTLLWNDGRPTRPIFHDFLGRDTACLRAWVLK